MERYKKIFDIIRQEKIEATKEQNFEEAAKIRDLEIRITRPNEQERTILKMITTLSEGNMSDGELGTAVRLLLSKKNNNETTI
jgi:hypothetical protein